MNTSGLPKQSLGFFPTPVEKLANLGRILGGPTIYIKRDDNSGLALGGNKTRKLEYILGDAVAQGADTIITAGAIQSNHCRQTAAAAARLGLQCHLLLGGEEPRSPQGNLLLDKLLGCKIHWAGENRKGEDIPELYNKLVSAGYRPYVVPYGGSNEQGAYAYVEGIKELHLQLEQLRVSISDIIFASSSGGTQAGLMVGNKVLNANYTLHGINIDKDETGDIPFAEHIIRLANSTAKLAGCDYRFTSQDLLLNADYLGEGYGVVGELEKQAISMAARYEGILVDPVYTGRALGALIDMVKSGRFSAEDNILFWHTGGSPALFACPLF